MEPSVIITGLWAIRQAGKLLIKHNKLMSFMTLIFIEMLLLAFNPLHNLLFW